MVETQAVIGGLPSNCSGASEETEPKNNFMNDLKPSQKPAARMRSSSLMALILLANLPATSVTQAADKTPANRPSGIPWTQIGAKAGANYEGDGLAVTPTESGARLHCVFQRLDGEATPEGLWLTSTVTNTVSDRFRVTAMAVGRTRRLMRTIRFCISRSPASRWRVRATYPLRPDGAFQPPRVDGRILREHGRRAAGFHRGTSATQSAGW